MTHTRRFLRTVGVAASLVLMSSPVWAQQWNIDAQAGRIRSALDPSGSATPSVVLGLRYDDVATAFRISGGIPTQSGDPLWGAAAAARRIAAHSHSFFAGVDLAGNAFVLHDRVNRTRTIPGFFGNTVEPGTSLSGNAFAGQVLPVLGFENGNVQGFVRAGVSQYSATFAGKNKQRTVQLGEAQATLAAGSSFALIPAVRYYSAPEGRYTYAGATALLSNGPLTLYGTVGQWLQQPIDSSDATPWSIGATLRLHERAALTASARHDGIDPLYLAPAQTAWNVGVSILVGGKTTTAAPIPARYESGHATIRLPVSQATTQPSIAGDFNDWKPVPMQRSGDAWTYTVALQPGVYNFSFVNDKGQWFVPARYPGRKDDGMGGQVAVLVVQR